MAKEGVSILEKIIRQPKGLIPIMVWFLGMYLLFYQLPDNIFFVKQGLLLWLPYFFIISLSTVIFIQISKIIGSEETGCLLWGVSILIFIPLFFFHKKNVIEKDFAKNGIITKGIINNQWVEHQGRKRHTGSKFYVQARFEINEKIYLTYPYNNGKDAFIKGDTVFVEYSSKSPENSRVIVIGKHPD